MVRLKTSLIASASSVLAFAGLTVGTSTSAFAYGVADQPVAQVEISGNCNNPSFFLCSEVGIGGVWAWAELDNVSSTTVLGWNEMDATFAGCGHTQGGGGPGTAGAHGGPDPFGVWTQYLSLSDALIANPAAFPFAFSGTTYSGSVYVLDFFPGSGADDFEVVVPTQQGHYSAHPVPGVSLQLQVAP